MIHGLSEYEKFRVLRPIIGNSELDEYGFPILSKEECKDEEWSSITAVGLQNASAKRDNKKIFAFNV